MYSTTNLFLKYVVSYSTSQISESGPLTLEANSKKPSEFLLKTILEKRMNPHIPNTLIRNWRSVNYWSCPSLNMSRFVKVVFKISLFKGTKISFFRICNAVWWREVDENVMISFWIQENTLWIHFRNQKYFIIHFE